MSNVKKVWKVVETSAVSGLTAGIGVLSTDGAHLTLKAAGAAGIAALVGFLYQINRQVGVAEGETSPVTTTVAQVSKIIEAQVPGATAEATVSPAPLVASTEVFPPKVAS